MTSPPSSGVTEQTFHRVCSEFVEMPGLQLTLKQAQRLWGLDEETCVYVLNVLVDAGFLRRIGLDKYGRAAEGAVAFPAVRPAKVPAAVRSLAGMKEAV